MKSKTSTDGVFLRVSVAPGIALGPGKANLLEGIKETGSIAAAGRLMGMSYKRAWYLVEALNSHFSVDLVVATKGGRTGGGAELTELGEAVLSAYREMQRAAAKAIAPSLRKLRKAAKVDMS